LASTADDRPPPPLLGADERRCQCVDALDIRTGTMTRGELRQWLPKLAQGLVITARGNLDWRVQ